MIDISIVIVNYNVKDFILNFISSIINTYPKNLTIEIIVVDNNSQDDSAHAIIENFPVVNLIINDKNLGFSKGINQGVKSAKGKYLFILNPDTILLKDSIVNLFNFMEKNINIGVIGPKILGSNKKVEQSFWRRPTLFSTILSITYLHFLSFNRNYDKDKIPKNKQVECLSGAALFVKLSEFNLLKGFDENLFWMEDIDFCVKSISRGNKNYYISESKIIHFKGKSSEKNWPVAIYNQLISKIKFFSKYHNKIEKRILIIIIFIISIIKSILLFISIPLNFKNYEKVKGYNSIIKNIILNNY